MTAAGAPTRGARWAGAAIRIRRGRSRAPIERGGGGGGLACALRRGKAGGRRQAGGELLRHLGVGHVRDEPHKGECDARLLVFELRTP